jgi:flagellar assembly protein FliH
MALIKGRDVERLVLRGFQDVGDLRRQAEEMVVTARAEAQKLLDEAQAAAQRVGAEAAPRGEEEGRKRGMDEGRAEGLRQGREEALAKWDAELRQLVASWTAALAAVESGRGEIFAAARDDVLDLGLAIGARIARRQVKADPSVVREHVAEAVAMVAAPGKVAVTVNPADRKLVESVLAEVAARLGDSSHVELCDDPAVERGGCVVTTPRGRIDATVDKQIERIAEALVAGTPPARKR